MICHLDIFLNCESKDLLSTTTRMQHGSAGRHEWGRIMSDDKTWTLEQKRELLQDIFGSNEELIDSAIQFLKEEEVMLVSLKPRYSIVKILIR
jgi:hypothetical protein